MPTGKWIAVSAERVQIAIHVDLVAFWGKDVYGDGVRRKLGGAEGESDCRAVEGATVFGAGINWLARGVHRRKGAGVRRNADIEVSPEV